VAVRDPPPRSAVEWGWQPPTAEGHPAAWITGWPGEATRKRPRIGERNPTCSVFTLGCPDEVCGGSRDAVTQPTAAAQSGPHSHLPLACATGEIKKSAARCCHQPGCRPHRRLASQRGGRRRQRGVGGVAEGGSPVCAYICRNGRVSKAATTVFPDVVHGVQSWRWKKSDGGQRRGGSCADGRCTRALARSHCPRERWCRGPHDPSSGRGQTADAAPADTGADGPD